MSPVHQVCPKPSCKAQSKGEEDKADRGRGGKTTSGNGQAWNSSSPRGQAENRQMEETSCEVIFGAPTIPAVEGSSLSMKTLDRKRHTFSRAFYRRLRGKTYYSERLFSSGIWRKNMHVCVCDCSVRTIAEVKNVRKVESRLTKGCIETKRLFLIPLSILLPYK